MRNGPNGISLFIVNPNTNSVLVFSSILGIRVSVSTPKKRDAYRKSLSKNRDKDTISVRVNPFQTPDEKKTRMSDATAPITKAPKTASNPGTGPSSHPMPSASFASPRPIHAPREKSHKPKSGAAAIGPASMNSHALNPAENGAKNPDTKARPANKYDHSSGIMV